MRKDGPKPASAKLRDVAKADGAFVMLELDLLASPAWGGQSINCRRLIDRLMIEHLRHAGTENGELKVSYDQLVAVGIHRKFIKATLAEAVDCGLLEIEGGQYRGAARTTPSKYRLTFLPGMVQSPLGVRYYGKATHDWRRVRAPEKTDRMVDKGTLEQWTNVHQTSGHLSTSQKPGIQQNRQTRLVDKCTPPSISGGGGDAVGGGPAEAPASESRSRRRAGKPPSPGQAPVHHAAIHHPAVQRRLRAAPRAKIDNVSQPNGETAMKHRGDRLTGELALVTPKPDGTTPSRRAKAAPPPPPARPPLKRLRPAEVRQRLKALCRRLDGTWPSQRSDRPRARCRWLPEIDIKPLREAITDHVSVAALAKGFKAMLAGNVVGITNEVRIARAIEIARARAAAYRPVGRPPTRSTTIGEAVP
jgi:hypothetical protein